MTIIKSIFISILIVITVGLAGCSSNNSFEVQGTDFEFEPKELTIPKGEEVTITFRNTGNVFHNLSVDNIEISNDNNKIHLEADVNETESITFTANEAGVYEMYCDEEGHEEMVGTLIVE